MIARARHCSGLTSATVALLVSCSKSPPPAPLGPAVEGTMAGHPFHAKSALLEVSMRPPRPGTVNAPPSLLFFETDVTCDRRAAAELMQKHLRVRNIPNADTTERQKVWFDFCLKYDGAGVECRIQSNEAFVELAAGSRRPGDKVRGRFEGQREANVAPADNGKLAGAFDAVVCDSDTPGGLKLVE